MSDANAHGRFVWYQLNTTDPEAAERFYTRVVGWGTEVWEGADGPYTMWTRDGVSLGGIMQLPEEASQAGARPHWLPYVGVDDVDRSVARAGELGGEALVPPSDIPDVGRFAVLRDPQGAIFAVFHSAGEPPGHDGAARIGEFSWHELATSDRDAALAFYRDLFGWDELDSMDMGEAGIYQMYGRHGIPLGGIYDQPATMPGPPAWLLYARVVSVDRVADEVRAAGGEVSNGPMEVPGGDRIVQCADPQGGPFALHSREGHAG